MNWPLLVAAVLVLVPTLAWGQPTVVDFDNPSPPGQDFACLNGPFGGIDWGACAWRWEGPLGPDTTKHVYFSSAVGQSRTFVFNPAPRTLVSLVVFAGVAGTLTLADDQGQTSSTRIPAGALRSVATGWAKGSTTVTVTFSAGWELGLTTLIHEAAGPPPPPSPPPGKPSAPKITRVDVTTWKLDWPDPNAGMTAYDVERGPCPDGPFARVARLDGGTVSYVDSAVQPGVRYAWRIRVAGTSLYSKAVCNP